MCLGTDAWRVASVETWQLVTEGHVRTQQVRVWRAIAPIGFARSPVDPEIPTVIVAATEIDAIGWCAPGTSSMVPRTPITVTVWRLADDQQTAVPISVRRIAPAGGETPFAALYREVSDCVAGFGCSGAGVPLVAPTWAAGRYVFRYQGADAASWWFGADVEVLPEPTPEVTPPAG